MEKYYSYSSDDLSAVPILLLSVSILTLIIFKIIISQFSGTKLVPPGPKGFPIIGNLYQIGPNRHLSLHLLSQKYGPIMLLKFFQSPVVVVSSPEMAKLFLKTHDRVFVARPPFAAGKYINPSNILWSPCGPYWRQLRKVFNLVMSNMNSSTTGLYERVRIGEARYLLSRLQSLSGKPVIIREHVTRYIVSIICRMVLGEDYIGNNPEARVDDLLELLEEWVVLTGTFYIGDWAPWLGLFCGGESRRKMKALGNKFDRLTSHVIDNHLAKKATNDDVDFFQKDAIEGLLKHAEAHQLPRDSVKALIQDFLVASTESTIVVVEWAIQEIIKQPRIYQKAKEELNNLQITECVTKEDLSQLPYIDAIIMETLRLHPPATIAPPHYAMEDCKVAGYDIRKGTVVLINTWSLGRDPESWESPNNFIPNRFIGNDIDMLGNNFALLPFGSGRRVCPGSNLGLNNVRQALANLLHCFDWKLPDGVKPEDICMEEAYGVNTHPKVPLSIIMEPTI